MSWTYFYDDMPDDELRARLLNRIQNETLVDHLIRDRDDEDVAFKIARALGDA